jgi:2'-5' RNA ligase
MRLFVATYPPDDVCDDLQRRVGGLRIGQAAASGVNVRLAPRTNWHVTLAFLGDVADGRRPEVDTALGRAVDGWRASAAGPPRLRLAGGGRFGRGQFTVLWVGLAGDVDALRALNRAIQRELKRARLPYEGRPFRPHLTLGRPGERLDRVAIEADRETLHGYESPAWTVSTVELVRSHLGPKPTYDHLTVVPL